MSVRGASPRSTSPAEGSRGSPPRGPRPLDGAFDGDPHRGGAGIRRGRRALDPCGRHGSRVLRRAPQPLDRSPHRGDAVLCRRAGACSSGHPWTRCSRPALRASSSDPRRSRTSVRSRPSSTRLGDRLAIGIEVDDERISPRGRARPTCRWTRRWPSRRRSGRARMLVTNVRRVGGLAGPDLETLRRVGRVGRCPLIASGGIATLEDVRSLLGIDRVEAAIIGRALLRGRDRSRRGARRRSLAPPTRGGRVARWLDCRDPWDSCPTSSPTCAATSQRAPLDESRLMARVLAMPPTRDFAAALRDRRGPPRRSSPRSSARRPPRVASPIRTRESRPRAYEDGRGERHLRADRTPPLRWLARRPQDRPRVERPSRCCARIS